MAPFRPSNQTLHQEPVSRARLGLRSNTDAYEVERFLERNQERAWTALVSGWLVLVKSQVSLALASALVTGATRSYGEYHGMHL
jgi:hypothetical protein